MGYELWRSSYTGLRRKGTTFREIETLFIDQITTKVVAEPLFYCFEKNNAMDMKLELTSRDFDYTGIADKSKKIIGYCVREELTEGSINNFLHPINLENLISDSTPLCKLFSSLLHQPFAFVLTGNTVTGIVTVWDINKPVIRIYLFGIISLFELYLNFWIDSLNVDGGWIKKVKKERMDEAQKLLELRKGNNDQLTLLECLQIADKKVILKNTENFLNDFEFTKTRFSTLVERVEIMRNEIAHSQNSIISRLEWPEFVKTVEEIEKFLRKSDEKIEK